MYINLLVDAYSIYQNLANTRNCFDIYFFIFIYLGSESGKTNVYVFLFFFYKLNFQQFQVILLKKVQYYIKVVLETVNVTGYSMRTLHSHQSNERLLIKTNLCHFFNPSAMDKFMKMQGCS